MGVFEEIRNWLSPEIRELKAKVEQLGEEFSSLRDKVEELERRLSTLESLQVQTIGEIKGLKESQLRGEEKMEDTSRMLLEIVRMIAKLEDKIELEKRIERLEEVVLKKK